MRFLQDMDICYSKRFKLMSCLSYNMEIALFYDSIQNRMDGVKTFQYFRIRNITDANNAMFSDWSRCHRCHSFPYAYDRIYILKPELALALALNLNPKLPYVKFAEPLPMTSVFISNITSFCPYPLPS